MVKMLERKGLILRQPGQARSLQVLIPKEEIPPQSQAAREFYPPRQTVEPSDRGCRSASGKLVRCFRLLSQWADE